MDSGDENIVLLNGKEDNYGGIKVDLMEVEPITVEDFDANLDASLQAWKDQGKKGIWMKLPNKLSNLVDTAIKKGFTYHHAEKEYAMLVSWISNVPSTIPANASHYIGIGAFVLNESKEMLVVKETSGYFKDKEEYWKMSTGSIKEGENIRAGAVREVKEETSIETTFMRVLAFSEEHQAHGTKKSDIFFLCELEPSTSKIKKQDSEILDAKWMPVEEYVNQPYHAEEGNKMFKLMADICLKRSQDDYSGLATFLTTTSSSTESYLYCSTDHANFLRDQASTSTSTSL